MSNFRNQNRELIQNYKERMIVLSQTIMKLSIENSKLENRLKYYRSFEEKFNNAKKKIEELNKKYEDYYLQKEKEIKELKLKYGKLETEREYESSKYNTNISIYNQKISMVHYTEMENEIYKNELKDLKEKNKELSNAVKKKLDSLEIKNSLKYKDFKKKVMNNLIEAKNKVTKLNLENMDTNCKIAILQNHQLLTQIENLQQEYDKLNEENKTLIKKISDLKNEIKIHKEIEMNLTLKINDKEKNEKKNVVKKKRYKCSSLNKFNQTTFSNYRHNNKDSFSTFDNNSSNINQMNISNLKNNISNKILYQDNLNKYLKTENNFGNIVSKSLISNDNSSSYKRKENNFSYFEARNQISKTPGKEINYSQLNKVIEKKNIEIENLKLKIDKLKDKINIYFTKYKGLFNFLEECLNEFFNDEEILNIKNTNINVEDIKKFNFEDFNKNEKYRILVLLMNHLMPIITLNFKSSCNLGNNLFCTNLNLIDKKFNSINSYMNDDYLKNAFLGKNYKLLNNLHSERRNDNFVNSIPILRKRNFPNDYRLLDTKHKTLI